MASVHEVLYPVIYGSLSEARSYSCLLGQLPPDLSSGVHAIASKVHPKDIEEPAFDDNEHPHVTVLYGLHTTNPADVHSELRRRQASNPATLKVGDISLFRHRDQDVLKLAVDSPDLTHLHHIVKKLPNSFSFPSYNPHITIAILKPGTGEKYLNLPNPLKGRETTMNGLLFSDPNHKYSYIPLRAPTTEDIINLRTVWGFNPFDLIEMTTAMAVGTHARPFGFNRPVYPSFKGRLGLKKRSPGSRAEGVEGQVKQGLNEAVLPCHLQIMNELDNLGWLQYGDSPTHSLFSHDIFPDTFVHVARRDEEPQWTVISGNTRINGNTTDELEKALNHHDINFD